MLHLKLGSTRIRTLTFLSAICAAATLHAQTTAALTLDEALRLFRERGFDLIIADSAVASAEADLAAASAIANPALSLSRGTSSTYDPSLCPGCSKTSISEAITDQGATSDLVSGKRHLRVAIARQNAAPGFVARTIAGVPTDCVVAHVGGIE